MLPSNPAHFRWPFCMEIATSILEYCNYCVAHLHLVRSLLRHLHFAVLCLAIHVHTHPSVDWFVSPSWVAFHSVRCIFMLHRSTIQSVHDPSHILANLSRRLYLNEAFSRAVPLSGDVTVLLGTFPGAHFLHIPTCSLQHTADHVPCPT